jgi:hypothetical protein
MSLSLANIAFDCAEPQRVAAFWSEALGRPLDDGGSEYFVSIGRGESSRESWFFTQVPEGKIAKNRVHLDLQSDDRDKEVTRLESLGATKVADHDEWGHRWTVLQDPEGNEFCVS